MNTPRRRLLWREPLCRGAHGQPCSKDKQPSLNGKNQLEGLRIALEAQTYDAAATSTLIESYFDERVREGWEFARILIERAEIDGGAEMFEEMDGTLLVGRNLDWEPQIAELVAGKNVVLAVGAAHLSGESGVLRALERAGYVLERL